MNGIEGSTNDMARSLEKIRQSLEILALSAPTREEPLAEEERRAWDMYAAAQMATIATEDAAVEADRLLEERRKRFGAGRDAGREEQPQPIGHCQNCKAPHYFDKGFCGSCGK